MSTKYFYHNGPTKWFGWKEILGDISTTYEDLITFKILSSYCIFSKNKVFKAVHNNKLNKKLYKNKIKKVHKKWLILKNI